MPKNPSSRRENQNVTDSPADTFSFDLTFHHETEAPDVITGVLGIQPKYAWAAGQARTGGVHRRTTWHGTAENGSGENDFNRALGKIAEILQTYGDFLRSFVATGGEIEVTANFHIHSELLASTAGDETATKIFDMTLSPDFIAVVGATPATLRINLWR
jgi:hypothetical protein